MMTDIEAFKLDLKKYLEDLNELKASNDPELDKKIRDLGEQFRNKVRKYLPTCLNIINTNFGCKFSLYKVGKDYNAAFKVVETNVRKSKEEVENELNALKASKDLTTLSPQVLSQIDLACDILLTYVDDGIEPKATQKYLDSAQPVASSIMTNVVNPQERFEQQQQLEQNNINFNPYANQPINLGENQATGINTPSIDTNAFNNSVASVPSPVQQPQPVVPVNQPANDDFVSTGIKTDSEYAYSDVIDASSISIFGVGSSNNNNNNN
jgi:hypothetical protein